MSQEVMKFLAPFLKVYKDGEELGKVRSIDADMKAVDVWVVNDKAGVPDSKKVKLSSKVTLKVRKQAKDIPMFKGLLDDLGITDTWDVGPRS